MEAAPPKPPRKRLRRPLLIAGAVVGALALVGGGAFVAPAAMDLLSEQGGGNGGGGADTGNDVGQAGGDGNAGDGEAGDGGNSGGGSASAGGDGQEGDDDTLPDAAVDQVSSANDIESATAEVGAAQGNVGLFTASLGGGIASTQVFVHSPERADGGMRFTVNGQTQGVRAEAPEFAQDAFHVVADGEELTPDAQFSYTPDLAEPQGQETNEFTLSIPGAPESGLLAFQRPTTDGEELPPVGICYDAADGIFTTEYAECT